jgi:prefoldin subunit 5
MKNRIEQAIEKANWDLDALGEEISELQQEISNINSSIDELEKERTEVLKTLNEVSNKANLKRGEIIALESLLE